MMKSIINKIKISGLLIGMLAVSVGCEREISDDAVPATFPNTADIYTDNPVGLTDEFFISIDPAEGANPEAFGTDDNESYLGTSSIRIAVPSPNNPNGNFVGGIFRDRGEGRDLRGYDALTFWAKGSVNGTLSNVGFGTDFLEDEYPAAIQNLELTTDWQKYIVPMPDPSVLEQERGMFFFTAGGFDVIDNVPNGNELAWTFWLDEIRFENLGTIGQRRPNIFNGVDETVETFSGATIPITGISFTANLPTGVDETISLSTNYFIFESSNPDVATVSESGIVSVVGQGEAVISARIGNLNAQGSLTVVSTGAFESAPDPTLPEDQVIPIYSDFYTSIPGLNVGAFNNEGIDITAQVFNGNELIQYQNLGFVGIGWNGTVDASSFTGLHLDVQRISPGSNFVVELLDFGPDGVDNGFGDGSAGGFNATSQMVDDQWVGLDIPLNAFTLPTGGGGSGNPNTDNLGFIILVSNSGSFLIDNIYFY